MSPHDRLLRSPIALSSYYSWIADLGGLVGSGVVASGVVASVSLSLSPDPNSSTTNPYDNQATTSEASTTTTGLQFAATSSRNRQPRPLLFCCRIPLPVVASVVARPVGVDRRRGFGIGRCRGLGIGRRRGFGIGRSSSSRDRGCCVEKIVRIFP